MCAYTRKKRKLSDSSFWKEPFGNKLFVSFSVSARLKSCARICETLSLFVRGCTVHSYNSVNSATHCNNIMLCVTRMRIGPTSSLINGSRQPFIIASVPHWHRLYRWRYVLLCVKLIRIRYKQTFT